MYILKTDVLNLEIMDYVNDKGIIAIDAKFNSKEDFDKFIEISGKHATDKDVIDYEVNGELYHGRFGNFVYDKNYNIRFYMTTKPHSGSDILRQEVWKKNVNHILNNQRSAIVRITDILEKASICSKEEVCEILQYVPDDDYGVAISHKVSDLQKYLEYIKETMEELRNPVINKFI